MADDPYVYPGTSVLRNLAEIHDSSALRHFESVSTFRRILELEYTALPGSLDAEHLQAIHRYIFQDVYSWAGKLRTLDIGKQGRWFCRPDYIDKSLTELLAKLGDESFLRSTSLDTFVSRAAHYLGELNAIHPFREGNGRAQREFIRELALQAGFGMDWSKVSREEMYPASEISFNTGDIGPLVKILARITRAVSSGGP
jgi:cell filamentation protein